MLRPIIRLIGPSIAYVELTQEQFSCINIDDIPAVEGRNWYSQWNPKTKSFYACRCNKGILELMHVTIIGKKEGHHVDHRNSQTLHNFKANLRHATPLQNIANMGLTKLNKTGFKGVSRVRDRYRVGIQLNGKKTYLGYYDTPEMAAEAYRKAAKELHGEFARFS